MQKETQTQNGSAAQSNAPDWIVKTSKGQGRNARFERIGAAWNRTDDGGICIRLCGTQIVSEDIYVFAAE